MATKSVDRDLKNDILRCPYCENRVKSSWTVAPGQPNGDLFHCSSCGKPLRVRFSALLVLLLLSIGVFVLFLFLPLGSSEVSSFVGSILFLLFFHFLDRIPLGPLGSLRLYRKSVDESEGEDES